MNHARRRNPVEEKRDKIMKKKYYIFGLFAAVLFLVLSPMQGAAAMEGPGLSVEGTGQAKLAPDQASISLSVVTTGHTAQETQAENARNMQAVTEAVKALGIEDRHIKTAGITLQPEYDYRSGERKLKGYTAVNSVRVEVKELSKVGRVIDSALRSGANKVDSLDFSLQAPERLEQTALKNAVADARSKAEVIAAALGKSIVGLRQVTENVTGYSRSNYAVSMLAAKAGDEAAASTPVEPGELELTASVHIEFVLSE